MDVRVQSAMVILGIFLLAVFGYISIKSERCNDFECFQRNMVDCSKAEYINEKSEASWEYKVKGSDVGKCEIEVTLLIAKKGEIGIDKLEGMKMNCYYPLGSVAFPEKDLTACTGELKEGLQETIINNLHGYIISNLGDIREELE